MTAPDETFFTVVGCMDGRCQEAVARFGREKFDAQFPDTITEAGLVGILAKEQVDQKLLDSIKKKIAISLEKHHSRGILVFGHQDCAASDAVSDEQHRENVRKAAAVVRSFVPSGTSVSSLFILRGDHGWTAERIE